MADPRAELVLHGGLVLTQDPGQPRAQGVAVAAGRIVCAGTDAEVLGLAGPHARRIDLGGRTLLPGFNDAHAHLWKMGHLLTGLVDLRGCRSLQTLGEAVGAFAAPLPATAWVVGRGFNEVLMAERRRPNAVELDRAAGGRPCFLTRTCGHLGVASTRALALARIGDDTPNPPGGVIVRDDRGRATGELQETAMGLVSSLPPEPTAAELERMVLAAMRHQLSLGITSSSEAGLTPQQLDVYRALDSRNALPLRVNAMALRRPVGGTQTFPLPQRHDSPFLRIDSIKLLADGGLSGATAALRVCYRHCEDHGVLRLTCDEIVELCREPHEAGMRIGIHAIGDAAIDAVLDAYDALGASRHGVRHRVEHFGLPHPEHLRRAATMGVIAVPQTIFLTELGVNFRRYLPDSLLGRSYPLREMLDRGLTVALSSDTPVVADDAPLSGIQAAVTRCDAEGEPLAPEQAIAVQEALAAYTLGGAIASGDDVNRGSLAPGKWADMTVLNGNPLATPAERLSALRADLTLVGGSVVYER
ncbi:MAG: amidohydrolase [Candidatus Wallbacteria bacterium]|nr:amidohydrolase [Candidatus Wallbacteria bacterium]